MTQPPEMIFVDFSEKDYKGKLMSIAERWTAVCFNSCFIYLPWTSKHKFLSSLIAPHVDYCPSFSLFQQLQAAGVEIRAYPVEPNSIVIGVKGGYPLVRTREFLYMQPEPSVYKIKNVCQVALYCLASFEVPSSRSVASSVLLHYPPLTS